jgi:DivIVA domain-containing protein
LSREDQRVTVFWVLLGIAVLCGVAVVASGRGDGLATADPDRPDLTLPEDRPVVRADVDHVRFSVGLRGYRMDEVDDVLDRLAFDIGLRDEQISELKAQLPRGTEVDGTPVDGTPVDGTPVDGTPVESAEHGETAATGAEPGEGAGGGGSVAPAVPPTEGAAMVPPVDVGTDVSTARTLLVPLEQFTVEPSAEDEPRA